MNAQQKGPRSTVLKRRASAQRPDNASLRALEPEGARKKKEVRYGTAPAIEEPRSAAREAALRYAEDSAFASEFESALQEIYLDHLDTLRRIRKRLGASEEEPIEAIARSSSLVHQPVATSGAPITPERVHQLIEASSGHGLTRGDIAARLGIDSRDARLTRVLRALKVDRLVKQDGIRRSARYHIIRATSGR